MYRAEPVTAKGRLADHGQVFLGLANQRIEGIVVIGPGRAAVLAFSLQQAQPAVEDQGLASQGAVQRDLIVAVAAQ